MNANFCPVSFRRGGVDIEVHMARCVEDAILVFWVGRCKSVLSDIAVPRAHTLGDVFYCDRVFGVFCGNGEVRLHIAEVDAAHCQFAQGAMGQKVSVVDED